jgi:DNA-binding SARP family transcriptional activator
VQVGLLGALVVTNEDGSLVISAPKERALLEWLALRVGREVSRDDLIDGLWGEAPPRSARKTLQTYVSNLRRVLPGAIKTTPHGYSLNVEPEAVDATRFEALLAEGRKAGRAGRAEAAAQLLAEALQLWRGEPLVDLAEALVGRAEQIRLHELRCEAEDELFDARLALGQHHSLAAELEAATASEPLRERRWAQLVLALYRSGRQADALRAYGRVRKTLADELGIDPGQDLQALEEAILLQKAELQWRPRAGAADVEIEPRGSAAEDPSGPRPAAVTLPAALARVLQSAPLAGRGAELHRCRTAWDEVGGEPLLAGSPASVGAARAGPVLGVLVVSGPAGIGKTRLVAELARDVMSTGAGVLYGRWDEEPLRPLQAIAEVTAGVFETVARSDAIELVNAAGQPLLWLLPELASVAPELRSPTPGSEDDRFRLFESVAGVLARRASANPLLIVLDDVQWADPPSLVLLRHLARSLSGRPLLLALTLRAFEGGQADPLAALLALLARDAPVTTVVLDGLAPGDMAGLVDSACGDPGLAARLTPTLTRVSEGNPFFILQLVRHLIETGAAGTWSSHPQSVLPVPGEVHALLQGRLDRLSGGATRALRAAAVLGVEFDLDVLAATVGLTADSVVDLIEEAMDAGVMLESANAVDRCRFAHVLLHEVVYARIPASRRRRLHFAAGQALRQALAAGAPHGTSLSTSLPDVARHLLAAHPLGDPETTVASAVAAAAASMSATAYEQAAWYLERALEIQLEAPGSSPDQVGRLLLNLGRAHTAAGETRPARQAYLRAFDQARVAGAAGPMAEAALGAGGEWVAVGTRDVELESLLADALAAAPASDSSTRVRLLARLASAKYYAAQVGEADALSLAALDLARRAGDPGALAAALHVRHLVLRGLARPEERLTLAREIVAQADAAGDGRRALVGQADQVFDLLELGNMEAVDREVSAYEVRAKPARRRFDTWWLATHRTMRALLQGRWIDAERMSLEALSAGEAVDEADALVIYATQLFVLRWGQGRLAELRVDVERMSGSNPDVAAWKVALAMVLADGGAIDEAQSLLSEVGPDGLAAAPRDGLWLATMTFAAQAAAATGDRELSKHLSLHLTAFAGRLGLLGPGVVSIGAVDRYRALAASTADDSSGAEQAFEAAHGLNQRIGAGPWEALTLLDHARHLRRLAPERGSEAAGLAQRARAMADVLAMPAVGWAAEQLLESFR